MTGIAIYMEGGGDGRDGRAALRIGMDALLMPLKEMAQRERLRWRLVACGGRDAAFKAFRNAANGSGTIAALLFSGFRGICLNHAHRSSSAARRLAATVRRR